MKNTVVVQARTEPHDGPNNYRPRLYISKVVTLLGFLGCLHSSELHPAIHD